MKPTFFATSDEFRRWLTTNHGKADEILVKFYKKGSGKPSLSIPDAQAQALCFGWIDGILRNTGPSPLCCASHRGAKAACGAK